MSKHIFSATTPDGATVKVQCGWDRPLTQFFLTVWEGQSESPADNILYTSLMESTGGLLDVESVAEKLDELGVELPEELYQRLWLDEEFNEGNGIKWWT